MKNKSKFIGIVTDVIDEHNFIFRSDNNVRCQIGEVIGLKIHNNIFIFARICKIDVDYFLTNSDEYFTSVASDNKLKELSQGSRSPRYSQRIKANYIGVYEFRSDEEYFVESDYSVNLYTPSIFQEVLSFDFDCIGAVFGLNQNSEKAFKLGSFLYPSCFDKNEFPDANIAIDTFDSHTLISGVTGSGKSRLTALIANLLSKNGGHITIIDPHNEYANLVDTETSRVSFFARDLESHMDRSDIYKRNLTLTNQYLTPSVLRKLLPHLSEQQYEYISNAMTTIGHENITLKKVIDTIIQKFNSDYKEEGHPVELLLKAQQYAKEDANYLSFINRYIFYLHKEWYKGKYGGAAKAEVAFTVLKRLIDIYKDDVFQDNINYPPPAWLDYKNRKSINILKLDYDSSPYIRRFIDAIIQCFFAKQTNNRTLIVDEAHLLLKEKSELKEKSDIETAVLLSRLLRESRKYKLSIVFVTQNETDVPEDIKSQFQNKFRFREENNIELKYLDDQTCMCSLYKGKLSFPMRVDNIEETK
jgi:energy-coupling factor transporter ATP-binding protein EcfA2